MQSANCAAEMPKLVIGHRETVVDMRRRPPRPAAHVDGTTGHDALSAPKPLFHIIENAVGIPFRTNHSQIRKAPPSFFKFVA